MKPIVLWLFFIIISAHGTPISFNAQGLSLMKFIELVSNQVNQNIVVTQEIEGEIDFIGHQKVKPNELLELLHTLLKEKGFELKKKQGLLYITKRQSPLLKSDHKNHYKMHQIKLKFAHVNEVYEMIKVFIDKKEQKNKKENLWALKDISNNALMVYADDKSFKVIQALIGHLDKETKQVYVHTKILEISENRLENMGMQYGLDRLYTSSGGDIFTLGANLGGSVNALSSDFNALFNLTAESLSSAVALGATLHLLKTNHVIDIVSEPSLLCLNNKPSVIYVGETKSFQTGLSVTDGGNQNSTFMRENIGLTLKVTPRITNENQVTLDILTIVEDAKNLRAHQVNPDTTKKEVQTRAVVNNAQSVILGGLIKTKQDTINTKVPILGDIPLLGALFQHKKGVEDKVNLVVIVTPYIVNEAIELTQINQALSKLKELEQSHAKQIQLRLKNRKEHQKQLFKQTNLPAHKKHEVLLKNL